MSKILFLGGSPSQLSVLRESKSMGHTSVLCDGNAGAPGVKLADIFYPVSTLDKAAILAVAIQEAISAVVAYASDPAANTAAYVAAELGLAGNPVEAVNILTHKDLYRKFLFENGFNVPVFYTNPADVSNFPVIVKPVDSSGSKGVHVARDEEELHDAVTAAKTLSHSGRIIIESFLQRKGYQVAGDGFLVDGKLVFRCFANEHFDGAEGLVPVGESFPSVLSDEVQQSIHNEIQRALDLLGMRSGALNFDVLLDREGKIYLLEIGPRAGGCLIPDVIWRATGFNEPRAVIEAALGKQDDYIRQVKAQGFWSSYMLHSQKDGVFKEIYRARAVENKIVDEELFISKGDRVKRYEHSGCTVGTAILSFSNKDEMLYEMDNMSRFFEVVTE